MTTIHGLGGTTPARPARTAPRQSGFQLAETPAEGETAASVGVENVTLGGLLALQEGAVNGVRDRAARRQGQRLLDVLRELQRARLASGEGLDAAARRLAELTAISCPADDPRLAAALRDIAVRAAVELARCERDSTDRG